MEKKKELVAAPRIERGNPEPQSEGLPFAMLG